MVQGKLEVLSERGRSQRTDGQRCTQFITIDGFPIVTDQGQVLEKREETDEVENLGAWKGDRSYAEGLESLLNGARETVAPLKYAEAQFTINCSTRERA